MNKKVYRVHLTEGYQLKAADELISKLNIRLGESESYIQELQYDNKQLQDKNKDLEKEVERLKELFKRFLDKYSSDVKELRKEPFIKEYTEEIAKLKESVQNLEKVRDNLIFKLNA